jgi:DNA transformation protein
VSLDSGFIEHVKDMLAGLGHITARRMFGGAGLYCDGLIFAFLDDDVMYLKTDEAGRAAFEAEGMGPFTFDTKDGPVQTLSYFRAPGRLLDDADDMREWASRAVEVSRRQEMAKARKKPRQAARPASRPAKAKTKPKAQK